MYLYLRNITIVITLSSIHLVLIYIRDSRTPWTCGLCQDSNLISAEFKFEKVVNIFSYFMTCSMGLKLFRVTRQYFFPGYATPCGDSNLFHCRLKYWGVEEICSTVRPFSLRTSWARTKHRNGIFDLQIRSSSLINIVTGTWVSDAGTLTQPWESTDPLQTRHTCRPLMR